MRYILDKLHSELAVFSAMTSAVSPLTPPMTTPTSAGTDSSLSDGEVKEESKSSTIVSEIFGGVLQSDVSMMM